MAEEQKVQEDNKKNIIINIIKNICTTNNYNYEKCEKSMEGKNVYKYIKTHTGKLYHICIEDVVDIGDNTTYVHSSCSGNVYSSIYDITTPIEMSNICNYCIYNTKSTIIHSIISNTLKKDMYKEAFFRCSMPVLRNKKISVCSRYVQVCDSYCSQHEKSIENVFIQKTPFPKDIYDMIIEIV